MEHALAKPATDRRMFPRYSASECAWLLSFRLYPGRVAALVNVSRGGALVEGREQLSPGSSLQMKIVTDSELLWARARVVRCEVAQLSGHHGATYRTAIGFEHPLTLQRFQQEDGYLIPRALAAPAAEPGRPYPENV